MNTGTQMATERHNLFISWSGERSQAASNALHKWLPKVIQQINPWASDLDIDKGALSLTELTRALSGAKAGIVCLTLDNLFSPWLLFEAGALSNGIQDSNRLYTFLLDGLSPETIKPPLSMFQATLATKPEIRKMVHSIAKAVGSTLDTPRLNELFEDTFARLEKELNSLPPANQAPPKPDLNEMVAEVLAWTRSQTRMRDVISNLRSPENRAAWEALAGASPTTERTYKLSDLIGPPPHA